MCFYKNGRKDNGTRAVISATAPSQSEHKCSCAEDQRHECPSGNRVRNSAGSQAHGLQPGRTLGADMNVCNSDRFDTNVERTQRSGRKASSGRSYACCVTLDIFSPQHTSDP